MTSFYIISLTKPLETTSLEEWTNTQQDSNSASLDWSVWYHFVNKLCQKLSY